MRALTVRQPWAWALVFGPKRVENRSWSTTYRGELVIHAGKVIDGVGNLDERILAAIETYYGGHARGQRAGAMTTGAALAVTHLTDVHMEVGGCCAPWGDLGAFHWVTNDPQPFGTPIPMLGRLSLWEILDDVPRGVPRGYLSGPPGLRVPQYESGPVPLQPEGGPRECEACDGMGFTEDLVRCQVCGGTGEVY